MSGPAPLPHTPLDAFDSTPLFMRELPTGLESDPSNLNDNTLAALQSLLHDGDPEEIASNFKDQGNDYFKIRRFREALGFYTQGIEALTTENVEGQESAVRTVEVKPSYRTLHNALLLNRAATNLELENFGRVLKDVHIVLSVDPRSSKALFRAARALIKLRRFEEAVDACDRKFDSENKDIKAAKATAQKGLEEEARKAREKVEAAEREKATKAALGVALKYHGITVLRSPNDDIDPSTLPFLDPALPTDPTTAELICRVALVYPQHAQTDLIIRFSTYDTLGAHLDSVLPEGEYPPWDTKQEYTSRSVNVYVRTRRGRVLKLGRNKTLAEMCASVRTTGKDKGLDDGLVVGQGVIAFVVVPRESEAEAKYLKSVKEEKDGGR